MPIRYIPGMIEELRAKGLLEHDQGAQVLRVARPDDKREIPPLLVVSSEGSAMYGMTDLATIVQRRKQFDFELALCVVDQRQADHFEQVFRAAELAGYAAPGSLEHIGFGTMNGPDGKPFKTRAGGVLKLSDLIGMAREKRCARLREAKIGEDFSPEEFESVADKVAIAALKIADLVNFRGTSYVFDLDRFDELRGARPGRTCCMRRCESSRSCARRRIRVWRRGRSPFRILDERAVALALDAFEAAGDHGVRAARSALPDRACVRARSGVFGVLQQLPDPAGAQRGSSRFAPGAGGGYAAAVGIGAGAAGCVGTGPDVGKKFLTGPLRVGTGSHSARRSSSVGHPPPIRGPTTCNSSPSTPPPSRPAARPPPSTWPRWASSWTT